MSEPTPNQRVTFVHSLELEGMDFDVEMAADAKIVNCFFGMRKNAIQIPGKDSNKIVPIIAVDADPEAVKVKRSFTFAPQNAVIAAQGKKFIIVGAYNRPDGMVMALYEKVDA